jgi:hypothetical protein
MTRRPALPVRKAVVEMADKAVCQPVMAVTAEPVVMRAKLGEAARAEMAHKVVCYPVMAVAAEPVVMRAKLDEAARVAMADKAVC